MTISYSLTARSVATKAMQDRGIIGIGVDPTGAELAYCVDALNLMLKAWAARGLTLWTEEDGTATTTPASNVVELPVRVIDVSEVRVLSAGIERQMTRWEKGEYATLPNKAQTGEPLIYSMVYADEPYLRIWPTPSTARTLYYTYARVIEDIAVDDPVGVPQMWQETVVKCLAARLDAFGVADGETLGKIASDAARLEQMMFDHDRPASYFIGSDKYA